MIAVNSTRISLADESNEYAKEIKAGIKQIKASYKFPLIFKYPERYKIPNPDNPSRPEWPGGKTIRFKETVSNKNNGTEEWQYFTSSMRDEKGNEVLLPNAKVFTGYLMVQEIEADFAFFLLYKSTFCDNSMNPDINKMNHEKHFVLENKKFEAFKSLQDSVPKTEAEYLITVDNSVLPEAKMRELAAQYNLKEAIATELFFDEIMKEERTRYVMSLPEIRVRFIEHLFWLHKTNKGIYNEFVAKAKESEAVDTAMVSFVRGISEKGIIFTRRAGIVFKWHYTEKEPDAKFGKEIHTCKTSELDPDKCIFSLAKKLSTDNALFVELSTKAEQIAK
jgi:hypothetical protein